MRRSRPARRLPDTDAQALAAAVQSEDAARRTLDITLRQEQSGYVNYQTVLNADAAYQQALISVVQARATRLGDAAALYQASGGGWWNRAQSDQMADGSKP